MASQIYWLYVLEGGSNAMGLFHEFVEDMQMWSSAEKITQVISMLLHSLVVCFNGRISYSCPSLELFQLQACGGC